MKYIVELDIKGNATKEETDEFMQQFFGFRQSVIGIEKDFTISVKKTKSIDLLQVIEKARDYVQSYADNFDCKDTEEFLSELEDIIALRGIK